VPRLREFRWDSWADWTAGQILVDNPSIIAVDTETTGLGYYDEPFAATLTWRSRHGSLKSGYIDLEGEGRERRIALLRGILDFVNEWVFHNAKFDLQKLLLIGATTLERIEEIELHDTQTAYTLLDENSTKGLKDLAVRVLKYDDTLKTVYKSGAKKGQVKEVPKEAFRLNEIRRKLGLKKEDGYHLLPRTFLIPYALRDTEFTLQLHEVLQPRLRDVGDPRLFELYADAMQLKRVLLRMESDGFDLDVQYTQDKASEYGVRVMEKWDKVVALVGDPDFNPRSPDQVKAAFKRRGVAVENTQAKTLQVLDDELAETLLDYRDDFKIHGTYLLGLLREHRGGRVHPNFNDDGARTGRMSSSSAKE
jgi:DNA polymerase I-like protein with 3'-5' exonuclease and polymerase domains